MSSASKLRWWHHHLKASDQYQNLFVFSTAQSYSINFGLQKYKSSWLNHGSQQNRVSVNDFDFVGKIFISFWGQAARNLKTNYWPQWGNWSRKGIEHKGTKTCRKLELTKPALIRFCWLWGAACMWRGCGCSTLVSSLRATNQLKMLEMINRVIQSTQVQNFQK